MRYRPRHEYRKSCIRMSIAARTPGDTDKRKVRAMNRRRLILAVAVMAIVTTRPGIADAPSYSMPGAAVLTRAGLPSEEAAKTVLSSALAGTRHPQWIDIPAGSTTVRSFVVF